jgi:hypothetical protein
VSSKQLAFRVRDLVGVATARILGRSTSGSGRAEELTESQVRTLLSVSTTAEIAAAYQPIGSYAASSHTHTASDITNFAEAVDDEVASLLVAGSGITLTYNDASNTLTVAASGGSSIGGSTGSTDNALLRADGTGGATLQSSAVTIDDSGNTSGVGTLATSGLTTVSYSSASTSLGGTGVPGQGIAVINSAGGTGRPFGVLFGGTSSSHFAGIFGSQVTSAGNTAGDLVIGIRPSSSNSSLTEAVRITFDGKFLVGNPDSSQVANGQHFIDTGVSASSSNLSATGSLSIIGKGSVATNAGSAVLLYGPWSGSSWTPAGGIRAAKTNSTNNDFGFDLAFHTRVNGGSNTEKMRLSTSGALSVTSDITSSGLMCAGTYTAATLPSASANAGKFAQVTDSSVTTFGSTVAGSGSNRVPVFSNGTSWVVA